MVKVFYNGQDRDATLSRVKVILLDEYKKNADYLYDGLPEYVDVLNMVPDKFGDYCELFEVADNCKALAVCNLDTLKRPAYMEYKKLSDFIAIYETSDLEIIIVIE